MGKKDKKEEEPDVEAGQENAEGEDGEDKPQSSKPKSKRLMQTQAEVEQVL